MRVSFAITCAVLYSSVACNREVAPPKGAPLEGKVSRVEGSLKPTRLRWDGSDVAVNSSDKLPRLQWQLSGSGRGQAQTAYQVLIASDPARLQAGQGDVWDSGKVAASESINIRYRGTELTGGQRGVWTVRIWDEQDRASAYAAPVTWEIARKDEEVEGDWIGRAHGPSRAAGEPDRSVTYVRKVISLPKGFKSARLFATALGVYEASINGQRVGEDLLAPGFTDPDKRSLVQRHEVGTLLREGENVVAAVVAGGWCTARLGGTLGSCGLEPPRVRVALEITLADGKVQALESDGSWKYKDGPIRSARLFGGEEYDARQEMPGWDAPGFNDADWQAVDEYDEGTERMVYHDAGPSLRLAEDLEPRETEPAQGVYLFDMGRSVAGWARITLTAPAGTQVSLRYADALAADGSLRVKSGVATDRYTAKGSGAESWEPRFTLHHFRYVEVRGLPARPALASLVGRAVHTLMPRTGTLETSSSILNELFASTVFAQQRAFSSVPSSGREPNERPGSLLQARAVAVTACLNRDVQSFYRKWLGDIRDAQGESAAYPLVAPGRAAPEAAPTAAAAGVLVPWAQYLCYDDRPALDVHATSMGRWLDHVKAQNPDLVWKNGLGAESGDPLESGPATDRALLATAELSYAAFALARMMRSGGDGLTAEAERYDALSQAARAAFNKAFVLPDGRLRSDTQTAYAVAIERDVLQGAALQQAGEHLAAAVERAERKPTTGLVATALLLPALSRVGRDDLAYALLERIGAPDSSHHPSRELAFAGVGAWMYDAIGGIALDPEAPAGRHVLVRPRPGTGLSHAKASFDSAHGRIETDWTLERRRFRLKLVVPHGSTATVSLPLGGAVSESGMPLSKAPGTKLVDANTNGSVIEVQAGSYEFSVEPS
jgi:alpha-L-rhamnosidase